MADEFAASLGDSTERPEDNGANDEREGDGRAKKDGGPEQSVPVLREKSNRSVEERHASRFSFLVGEMRGGLQVRLRRETGREAPRAFVHCKPERIAGK
jgi:hypothetical protein